LSLNNLGMTCAGISLSYAQLFYCPPSKRESWFKGCMGANVVG